MAEDRAPRRLSREQIRGLEKWWAEAASVLRLQDRTLQVVPDVVQDDENLATTETDPYDRWFKLQLWAPFWDLPPAARRHTLTHEACHVLLWDLVDCMDPLLDLTKREEAVWEAAVERLTDKLADVLVDRVPPAPF